MTPRLLLGDGEGVGVGVGIGLGSGACGELGMKPLVGEAGATGSGDGAGSIVVDGAKSASHSRQKREFASGSSTHPHAGHFLCFFGAKSFIDATPLAANCPHAEKTPSDASSSWQFMLHSNAESNDGSMAIAAVHCVNVIQKQNQSSHFAKPFEYTGSIKFHRTDLADFGGHHASAPSTERHFEMPA